LFLRQVDDLAISTKTRVVADTIIHQINTALRMPVKQIGVITRFNGIDVDQTKYYVKLHCTRYLTKMLHHHGWIETQTVHQPLPFLVDKTSIKQLHDCQVPTTIQERQKLQEDMGFSYRQVMGEIMFPMVKC